MDRLPHTANPHLRVSATLIGVPAATLIGIATGAASVFSANFCAVASSLVCCAPAGGRGLRVCAKLRELHQLVSNSLHSNSSRRFCAWKSRALRSLESKGRVNKQRMVQNANETVLSMKQEEWRMVANANRESRSVDEIILAVVSNATISPVDEQIVIFRKGRGNVPDIS